MRYIKVLSVFVIIVVALLLISTIRTYASNHASNGFTGAAIIACDGDLEVIKADITDTDADCCTGSDCSCQVEDPCDKCLEACIAFGYDSNLSQSGSGTVTYLLTGVE